jgi:hypothetical protein
LNLPQPPADLRARRKGDRVLLTWTLPTMTTDRHTIDTYVPTRICRGLEPVLQQCGAPVGKASPVTRSASAHPSSQTRGSAQKISASYADSLPSQLGSDNPVARATYAIEALSGDGKSAGLSNQVRVPLAGTLPPPTDFRARLTAEGVVLNWTEAASPVTPQLSYLYRIFRRSKNESGSSLVGEVWDRDKTALSLTDSTIEWEQTYSYHVEAITILAENDKAKIEIEGDDSPEVEIFTHDTFPPAVPAGVQAVFSGPGQQVFIDLIWAPVSDMDLAGYNVYRHEDGGVPVKLNADLVKSPAYRDTKVSSGKNYFYSVAAVDVRENESAQSEPAGESVP